MNDILKNFGMRIRRLRAASHYSQEAFAERCGLDRTYVGGVERGERNISLRNIDRMANALGITLSDLFRGIRDA